MGAVKRLLMSAGEGDAAAAAALASIEESQKAADRARLHADLDEFIDAYWDRGIAGGWCEAGEEDCSECDGDGRVVTFAGPGHERAYGFEPYERVDACDACGGTGRVAVWEFHVSVIPPTPTPTPDEDEDEEWPF